MFHLTRRTTVLALGSMPLLSLPAIAAPQVFRLDPARSQVGFSVTLGAETLTGTMPVSSADLSLDLQRVANSRVSVTLNAAATQMSAVFARDGLKSAEVLDTARFPTITFTSTSVATGATGSEAVLTGQAIIRGVTKPLTLNAQLSQEASTLSEANPELSLVLTGAVDRRDFGASGYANFVGPIVQLRIVARIRAAS